MSARTLAVVIRTATVAYLLSAALSGNAGAAISPSPWPARADAQQTTRATESLRIAREFWHAPLPCMQIVAVDQETLSAATTQGDAVGAFAAPCSILLLATHLSRNDYLARVETCNYVVHEVGHALGFSHDSDFLSVMTPGASTDPVVYGCYDRFVPKSKRREWRSHIGKPQFMQRPATPAR